MTENELIDEIRDYVHNIHTAEPFHGFSFRELREVGEHFALPREKRITELEKENAELKEKREQDCDSSWYEGFNCSEKERLKQLTTAKDHIKKLLGCLQQDTNDPQTNYYVCKYMTEAEQFLKEVEE